MKLKKRIAALLMAGAMVCSTLPVNVLAVENSNQNVGGLCEHHPQHTADCGYTEGTPCIHEHNEDCYTFVTECVHEHTDECYPVESVSDNTATPSDAEDREPTACTHECSEENSCITKELDCQHEHDEACGYSPATPGTPCTFVCEICNPQDNGKPVEPVCSCETLCTAEAVNTDCPVCGAENADLSQCKGKEADEQVKAVQELVDALPTVEEVEAMTAEEQQAVYEKLQATHAAYQELTEEQKAKITGAEKLDNLFAFFAGKTNALINGVTYLDENGDEQTADNVTVVESSMTAWSDGWYVVNSTVTINNRVTVSGDVHLILADGASLTAKGGINVAENNSFSVYAQSVEGAMGTLTATGLYCEAGIGGGNGETAGTVTINGGNVTATGGQEATGIGGGFNSSGGNITISGGTVNATGGEDAAGIGGGFNGGGGTITINGGSVTATGGSKGAGIGGGNNNSGGIVIIDGGTVTATGGIYAAGIGGGISGSGVSFTTGTGGRALIVANGGIGDKSNLNSWSGIIFEGDNGTVYQDQSLQEDLEIPSGKTLTVPENTTLTVNSGVTLTNDGTIENNGTITNNGTINGSGTITGSGKIEGNQPAMPAVSYLTCDENGQNWETKNCTNYTLVESSTTTWSDGWYVVNGAVTIDSRVTVSGDVHLILANGASLTVNNDINVKDGNSFTVYAQSTDTAMGILTAKNTDMDEAGIGGGSWENAGIITINGGNVTATGGTFAAGIGGGDKGSGGTITINGGNVTATGGSSGAGIGGGYSGSGGKITINDGKVTAKGGNLSAGIGSGNKASSGGDITINGGIVTATGAGGAGIGGGHVSPAGTVIITGGIVTATGGNEEAGIGSGKYGSGGSVTISGGSVTATGGKYGAAGIGAGLEGSGVTFQTGANGDALIIANGGIGDKSSQSSWSGIIFDGDDVGAYGNQTISPNLEITGNQTLTVPEGSTLTIPQGVTLTCDTTLTNDGTIAGDGTLDGTGTLEGSGTVADTITNNLQKDTAVSVTISLSTATYGSKVTITAKISKVANTFARAAKNQVEFFVEADGNKTSLGTAAVNGDTATLSDVEISQEKFAVGENTITAEYGGSMGLTPESGTATLTIERITPTPTTPTGLTAVYGQTLADVSLPEKWAWDAPETSVGNVGEKTFSATYTEDNSGNYNEVKQNLTVKVNPAAYQITLTGQADSPIQVTLNEAVVEPGNTGTTVTYGYSTTNDVPSNWQTERVFTGLTADTTYYFFAKAAANGNYAETISQGVAIATPEKAVDRIEVINQPANLSYTSGQTLDLSGLSVKVNYNDNTSENITWDSGKLTSDPTQGTVLTVAEHDGKVITISYGGKTAQTNALVVGKAEQAALSITGAPGKIYKGSSFALQTSGGSGEGAVTWSVVSGSATVDANGTVTVTGTGEFQIKAVKDADVEYNQAEAVITLTAEKKPSSGGGGGSSSGGSSSKDEEDSTIIDRPDKNAPNAPTTGQTAPVKPGTNGNANINGSTVQQAIDKAVADAKKNGNTANGIAVVVPVNAGDTRKDVQIILKADTLDKLVSSKVKHFTIDTDSMTDFGFTLDTLKELNRQTSGDIVFKVKKTTVSSAEAKAAIGNRPVYDISLWKVQNSKETKLSSLNGKTISIAIPYTPAKGEQSGNLYAVYVDDGGKVEWLTKSSYDADQKAVVFEAAHFSVYGVGYKTLVPVFTDISGHWAKDNIVFAASRGLLSGTSETTFSPDTGMTRGMFVTALGRLAGVDPADYSTGKFTDVKADAYYAPYVNWAAKIGIVEGVTSTTFAPDININREQMAVIMKNYAAKLGYTVPKALEAVTFADNANISSWAREAVKSMQQAGVLAGKTNNRFDPAGTATRAEVATVLRRFVEIVIDPQTANGWQQNDSGEWSYYKNGEPVKGWLSNDQKWYWLDKNTGKMFTGGWKQIDGKQYYFYADGSMAVNSAIDGKTVGADGARVK